MNYTLFHDFRNEVISYVGYRLGRVLDADQFDIDVQSYDVTRYTSALVFINRSMQPPLRIRVYLQPGGRTQVIGTSFRLYEDPSHAPSPDDEVYVLEATANIELLRQWYIIKQSLNTSSANNPDESDDAWVSDIERVNFIAMLNGNGGSYYHCVVELGGYLYAAGYQNTQAQGYYDGLLVKYDVNGNLLWQRGLGETGYDFINALTTDGTYLYAVGTHYGQEQNSSDALVVKYDTNGNLIWQYCIGASGNEEFNAIVTDGPYLYIAGRQDSDGEGSWDAFIVKCDTDANPIWQRGLGGSSNDYFTAITTDGSFIYAAGVQYSQGQGHYEALLVKYDANGNLIWQRGLGESNDEYLYAVATDGVHVYAAGYCYSYGQGSNDAFIVKYDANGNLIWQRSIKGVSDVRINALILKGNSIYAAGSYYVRGIGNYIGFIVNYSIEGALVWQRSLNTSSYTDLYALTADGSHLYAAGCLVSSSNYNAKALLASMPMNGEITLNTLTTLGLGWIESSLTSNTLSLTAYATTLSAYTLSSAISVPTLSSRPTALPSSYSAL